MPINVMVFYVASCDECDDGFDGGDGPDCHIDRQGAEEMVEILGGVVHGDHAWCEAHVPPCTCGHTFQEHYYWGRDPDDTPCAGLCTCERYTP